MSRWDEGRWAEARWATLKIAELLQQPPATDRGVPIGLGDWKLVVEVLLPADQLSSWGVGKWGAAEWNVMSWHDLTPWVRGLEWSRGSDEPYGRPRVGELTVTLASDGDRFSPWNPSPPVGAIAYFGPGTVIRAGCRSATDERAGGWLPQITCVVDSWGIEYVDATLADRFVEVRAVETLRDLAQVDENAIAPVGSGEYPAQRLERLLGAAGWRYGLVIEAQNVRAAPAAYPLLATQMADNRLAECYRVADACDCQFRTDRTGAAILTSIPYIGTEGPADPRWVPLSEFSWYTSNRYPRVAFTWSEATIDGDVRYLQFDPPSFKSGNTDHNIVNVARFARVGGTEFRYQQDASVSRHGPRVLMRHDFIVANDLVVEQIAHYTTRRRALNTLRVDALTLQVTDRGTERGLVALAADLASWAVVYPPRTEAYDPQPYVYGYISTIQHRVTPRNSGEVTWEATFGFDTRTVHNLPGAQLPESPAP